MLTTLKSKGLLWPAIMAVAGVAILIALGTWQMQRMAWKQRLLADISQRAHVDPVAVTRAEQSKRAGADVEYLRVKVGGQFLHDKERHDGCPEVMRPGRALHHDANDAQIKGPSLASHHGGGRRCDSDCSWHLADATHGMEAAVARRHFATCAC